MLIGDAPSGGAALRAGEAAMALACTGVRVMREIVANDSTDLRRLGAAPVVGLHISDRRRKFQLQP